MENNSILDQFIFQKLSGWITQFRFFKNSNGGVWMFLFTVVSLMTFCMLWVDTSYWPWWMFVLLWILSMLGVLFQSIAIQLVPTSDQTLTFDVCWFALQTFSTHVNVLGALHVLDTGVWATLFVTTMTGVLFFMPHWTAVVTRIVSYGRFSSPTELRVGSTTVSLLLSPVHHIIRAYQVGDYIAFGMASAFVLPIFAYILTASKYADEKRKRIALASHIIFSIIPSIGMAVWAIFDPWLAMSTPVVFAGVLVLINTHVVARVYVLRVVENRNVIISFVEFIPFVGAVLSVAGLLEQPYSLFVTYIIAFFLTSGFIIKTMISLSSN